MPGRVVRRLLSCITLRMAYKEMTLTEELEIVSLSTRYAQRDHHLHCSVSKRDGSCSGGHCKGPATVRTTAEIVVGVLPNIVFSREMDDATGYLELQIGSRD